MVMLLMVSPLHLLVHGFGSNIVNWDLDWLISVVYQVLTLNEVLTGLLCDNRDLVICRIGAILGVDTLMMVQQSQMRKH